MFTELFYSLNEQTKILVVQQNFYH